MKIWNVEEWKQQITVEQLQRWMAHYRHDGGFGCEWKMMGRVTSLIRAALVGNYQKDDEIRFQLSYKAGDEAKPLYPLTREEIAERLARIPGIERTEADG